MDTDFPFASAETLWVVHIGNNDHIAQRARDEGFVSIGWTKIGDLSPHNTRQKMRTAMEKAFPNWKSKKVGASFGQTYRFAHEMEIGDPVIFPIRPTREIAIGRVSSEYYWSLDEGLLANGHSNVRSVDWLKIVPRTAFSQTALHGFGAFLAVSTSNDHIEEVQTVLRIEAPEDNTLATSEEVEATLDLDNVAHDLHETAAQETEDYLLKAWQRTGTAFEKVVGALFEALGYTANVTQASSDHGVDIIAHPDALGLEQPFIKVQAKSGTGKVGEREVNQLRGLLNPGEKGVLVSLGAFTEKAKAVERNSLDVTLIGPQHFVELFLEHYDHLAPEWQAKFPLRRVFVPIS